MSVIAIARAMSFYLVTFTLALPLFAAIGAIFPFTYHGYTAGITVVRTDIWAVISTGLFFKVRDGKENLPPADTGAVYVANHASYLDIYSLSTCGALCHQQGEQLHHPHHRLVHA